MRLPNWNSRLAAVIREKQRGKFEWGRNDCSLFACDCIQAVMGIDPAEEFRGKYDSRLSGARLVKEVCDGTLEILADSIAARLGFVEVALTHAQRGDLGLYHDPTLGDTLGINIGGSFAFLMEQGMIYLPADKIARVWRVG
jgi:hypothetical protein